jgi:dihydrofolate reductase
MRKVILYIACSLNGKIAKSDGSVDWLNEISNPDKNDFGYSDFYNSVEVTIQGYRTYKQIESWGIEFPYKKTTNYVFTRNKFLLNNQNVRFISENHADFVRNLKNETGKNIWLVGGSQLNAFFLQENLLDEIRIFIMPVIVENGIDVTDELPNNVPLHIKYSKTHTNGVVELHYKVNNTE